MLNNQLINEIMEQARKLEISKNIVIDKIYIKGEKFYFDKEEIPNNEMPDYTLIRSDLDPNFTTSLNTERKIKERKGF